MQFIRYRARHRPCVAVETPLGRGSAPSASLHIGWGGAAGGRILALIERLDGGSLRNKSSLAPSSIGLVSATRPHVWGRELLTPRNKPYGTELSQQSAAAVIFELSFRAPISSARDCIDMVFLSSKSSSPSLILMVIRVALEARLLAMVFLLVTFPKLIHGHKKSVRFQVCKRIGDNAYPTTKMLARPKA